MAYVNELNEDFEEKGVSMLKQITESRKKLMQEAFTQGFKTAQMGQDLEAGFKLIWDKLLETTFSKPEWKPYMESARSSYHFCFENGYASGVHTHPDISPEVAFWNWFKVSFR